MWKLSTKTTHCEAEASRNRCTASETVARKDRRPLGGLTSGRTKRNTASLWPFRRGSAVRADLPVSAPKTGKCDFAPNPETDGLRRSAKRKPWDCEPADFGTAPKVA